MKKKINPDKILHYILLFIVLCFSFPFLLGAGISIYSYYQKRSAAKIIDAVNTNDIEELKKLRLSKGINGYYNGSTPLIYAVKANNVEAVKYFIEQGADVNLKKYCPPYTSCVFPNEHLLHIAKNQEIIELLIANGAKE